MRQGKYLFLAPEHARIFFLFIFFLILSLLYFFHYHLVPLYPSCPIYHHIVVHIHESFFLFTQSLLLLNPLLAVIFFPSMNLYLFYFLVQLVHYIPHMSEIIWYSLFSDWFISLNIIFSSFIHTVTKSNISFFLWPSSIPLSKWPILVLSIHLLMDTWAASISWKLQIMLQRT